MEAYKRACHALAYSPVDPWPGGHRSFYRAAYEFTKANGYQRRDLVEQLFESLTTEQQRRFGFSVWDTELDTAERIRLELDPGMPVDEIEQEAADALEFGGTV